MNEWEIHERIKILEKGFEKFTISGAPGRDVQGSFATGFAVNFVKKKQEPAPPPAPEAVYDIITYDDSGTPNTITAVTDSDAWETI